MLRTGPGARVFAARRGQSWEYREKEFAGERSGPAGRRGTRSPAPLGLCAAGEPETADVDAHAADVNVEVVGRSTMLQSTNKTLEKNKK